MRYFEHAKQTGIKKGYMSKGFEAVAVSSWGTRDELFFMSDMLAIATYCDHFCLDVSG